MGIAGKRKEILRGIVGKELEPKITKGYGRTLHMVHTYKGSGWSCAVSLWDEYVTVLRTFGTGRDVKPDEKFYLGRPDLNEAVRAKIHEMLNTDLVEDEVVSRYNGAYKGCDDRTTSRPKPEPKPKKKPDEVQPDGLDLDFIANTELFRWFAHFLMALMGLFVGTFFIFGAVFTVIPGAILGLVLHGCFGWPEDICTLVCTAICWVVSSFLISIKMHLDHEWFNSLSPEEQEKHTRESEKAWDGMVRDVHRRYE